MDVSNTRQRPATGSSTGGKRRRIRPSRARGLRTKTGWERRVKCDDGKPTCLRCSKSDRACRYAENSGQTDSRVDRRLGTGNGTKFRLTEAELDSNQRCEEPCIFENRVSDSIPTRNSPKLQTQRPSIGAPPYVQITPAAPPDDGRISPNVSVDTSLGERLNESVEQTRSSLDPPFSTSPLSLGQGSLLNISPFEWYDLLARDAISHANRLNDLSGRDPRWKFPEIILSRRQSPAPECPDAEVEPNVNQCVQRQGPVDGHDHSVNSPSLDRRQLSCIWNTPGQVDLSTTDLMFFRYYIEVVGPILDLFDPRRHFSHVVPHLALRNVGLLKSILAVGAKHKSLDCSHATATDGVSSAFSASNENIPFPLLSTSPPSESDVSPKSMATQYYYETLQYLSQTLLYPAYADSHEILATATMISTYEMFDADSAPNSGVWEQHLKGSFWIQRSQDNDGESPDGLRQAVWWAWLRQDIWAAFQAGRPTITFWVARKPLELLTPDEFATRIVYICGKCVKYASGEISPDQDLKDRIDQADRLLRTLDEWQRALPSSYQPVKVAPSSDSDGMFPSIWIHPPTHAGAIQMYHFARSIVLLNQPTMGGLHAYMHREKELAGSVKMVCGIANSCQEYESANAFVNVQALFGVGQFVRAPEVRSEILRLLHNMLRISKFPTKRVLSRLEEIWEVSC
ncbi:unnamed protein product [Penicillium salamii]|uniref:Zn(2)-C6 fungal-type domain-containing protein n=1 Tax=Penicillium salamii TaxID=1612424 RepID=A0A9W4JD95_9EURO|nr:unnamed protein product [Penicillium salamii]CAG8141722.1 unnamed protein product [Penicillium salamii]CAG8141903.1 unnamed protein product [Penicillium salamii]CAG8163095.1 unnamed protein product [Penicillium salamii]CAG8169604.1 unnamed protein product [Penicillium salamii]